MAHHKEWERLPRCKSKHPTTGKRCRERPIHGPYHRWWIDPPRLTAPSWRLGFDKQEWSDEDIAAVTQGPQGGLRVDGPVDKANPEHLRRV